MFKFLLIALLLVSVAAPIGTRGVVTGPASPVEAQGVAYASGWYDWKPIKMSTNGGDLNVHTTYGAMYEVVGVINQNPSSAATIIVKTKISPTVSVAIPLSSGEKLWPLPEITSVVQTGTSDSLILCIQRIY